MTSDQNTWGLGDSVGNNNLLDLVTEVLLDGGAKTLKVLDVPALSALRHTMKESPGSSLLTGLLLLWGLLQVKSLLGNGNELLAVELLQLGDSVLVNGVDK